MYMIHKYEALLSHVFLASSCTVMRALEVGSMTAVEFTYKSFSINMSMYTQMMNNKIH